MDRRAVIRSFSLSVATLTSGCFGSLATDGTKTVVKNRSGDEHDIAVEYVIRGSNAERISKRYAQGQSRTFADVPPNNDWNYPFTLRVAVDGKIVDESKYQYENDKTYLVKVMDTETVEIEVQ